MKQYYKIIDDVKLLFKGNVLYTDQATIINPTEEQMVENGWTVYEPTQETEEEKLNKEKMAKISLVDSYDSSPEVETFYIDNTPMWLGHELRQQIRTSAEAYVASGHEDMTKVFNGKEYTFPINTWLYMLNILEIYAAEALNTTERHKHNINNLNSVEEVIQYDFTTGYPEKITFTTE